MTLGMYFVSNENKDQDGRTTLKTVMSLKYIQKYCMPGDRLT